MKNISQNKLKNLTKNIPLVSSIKNQRGGTQELDFTVGPCTQIFQGWRYLPFFGGTLY